MVKLCKFASVKRPNGSIIDIMDYQEVINWSLENEVIDVWEEEINFPDAK